MNPKKIKSGLVKRMIMAGLMSGFIFPLGASCRPHSGKIPEAPKPGIESLVVEPSRVNIGESFVLKGKTVLLNSENTRGGYVDKDAIVNSGAYEGLPAFYDAPLETIDSRVFNDSSMNTDYNFRGRDINSDGEFEFDMTGYSSPGTKTISVSISTHNNKIYKKTADIEILSLGEEVVEPPTPQVYECETNNECVDSTCSADFTDYCDTNYTLLDYYGNGVSDTTTVNNSIGNDCLVDNTCTNYTAVCNTPIPTAFNCSYECEAQCQTPADCDDNNPLTLDDCVGCLCSNGAVYCNADWQCNDNNNMTADWCNTGTCQYDPLECIDEAQCPDNNCNVSYPDYCTGTTGPGGALLVDWNNDGSLNNRAVTDTVDNVCLADNTCTNYIADCSLPQPQPVCSYECGAQCLYDIDCDDSDSSTQDSCLADCSCLNIPNSCTIDSDCPDTPTLNGVCENNSCVYYPINLSENQARIAIYSAISDAAEQNSFGSVNPSSMYYNSGITINLGQQLTFNLDSLYEIDKDSNGSPDMQMGFNFNGYSNPNTTVSDFSDVDRTNITYLENFAGGSYKPVSITEVNYSCLSDYLAVYDCATSTITYHITEGATDTRDSDCYCN